MRLLGYFFAWLFMASTMSPIFAQDRSETIRDSVVKVFTTEEDITLTRPWERRTGKSVTGSGVVISPNTILTNFHVIKFSKDTSIQLNGESERLSATVTAQAPGLDLAIITLEKNLPEEIVPVDIAESIPDSGAKVQVFGYPKGGQSLSVTEGVLSRVEYVGYRARQLGLRLQVDAPINSGNSGGPVIANDEVIGLSVSILAKSNDIGYAIPCVEIQQFLNDVKDGTYDGKPRVWWSTQRLTSKTLRKWMKLPEQITGIRFDNLPIDLPDYPLQTNDVITRIGKYDVDNAGKVKYGSDIQVPYQYAVEQTAKDGFIEVKIFRDGESKRVQVPVTTDGQYLLPYLHDERPSYFVYGPIVFGVGVAEFGDAITKSPAFAILQQMKSPYVDRRFDRVRHPGEQLVVITSVIPHPLSRDLGIPPLSVVKSINGQTIDSIHAAAKLIAACNEDSLVIELDDVANTKIVLDRLGIEKAHEDIMEANGIVRSASKDLRDVWTK